VSCLLEVPFSAPMMLIFGGKGFEHVKEMEMAEMAEMALKFL
jgi:hypothetical protein